MAPGCKRKGASTWLMGMKRGALCKGQGGACEFSECALGCMKAAQQWCSAVGHSVQALGGGGHDRPAACTAMLLRRIASKPYAAVMSNCLPVMQI